MNNDYPKPLRDAIRAVSTLKQRHACAILDYNKGACTGPSERIRKDFDRPNCTQKYKWKKLSLWKKENEKHNRSAAWVERTTGKCAARINLVLCSSCCCGTCRRSKHSVTLGVIRDALKTYVWKQLCLPPQFTDRGGDTTEASRFFPQGGATFWLCLQCALVTSVAKLLYYGIWGSCRKKSLQFCFWAVTKDVQFGRMAMQFA